MRAPPSRPRGYCASKTALSFYSLGKVKKRYLLAVMPRGSTIENEQSIAVRFLWCVGGWV